MKILSLITIIIISSNLFALSNPQQEKGNTTMKIVLTSVYVSNPPEAFKFYTEILGFEEKMYMPEAHLAIVASPQDHDGVQLLLEPNQNPIAKEYQERLYDAGLPVIVFGLHCCSSELLQHPMLS